MSKSEPLLGTNLMPKEPALLVRVMLTLLPILIASGIGFNVYLTQQIASLDKRVSSTEGWRDAHEKRVPEILAQIAKERDEADRAYKESTLRQVEAAAAGQRENILAQLASIQRDVLKIAVILDTKRDVPTWPRSSASGVDTHPQPAP